MFEGPFSHRHGVRIFALATGALLGACSTGSVAPPPGPDVSTTGGSGGGSGGKGGAAGSANGGKSGAGATGGATTGKGGASAGGKGGTGGAPAGPGGGGKGSSTCPPTTFGGLPPCAQTGKAPCITCACNDVSQSTLCAGKYSACVADVDCAHTVECVLDGCSVDKCQSLVNGSLKLLLDLQPCFQTTCAKECADIIPGGGTGGAGTGGTGTGTGGTGAGGKAGTSGAGGAAVCAAGTYSCTGGALEKCAPDGSGYAKVMDCAMGTTCDASAGKCQMGTGCGMAWEIAYTVNGTFSITDTTLGAGDAQRMIGPGAMKLRFEDKGGAPGGKVHVLSYTMPIKFNVSSAGLSVDTDVTASVPYDPCGHASGVIVGTALGWDACAYGPTWNTGKGNWHGDANAAMGPGCLNGYSSAGNVHCSSGVFAPCSAGNLKDGDNPQSGTWNQPLNGFEYAADGKSFKMRMLNAPMQTASYDKGVETPNAQPSRTWFTLDATETGRTLVPAPCSCN